MFDLIFRDKLKIALTIVYFLYSQYSLDSGNHVSKILMLIPVILFLDIKKIPVKMLVLLSVIPLLLFIRILIEDKSNSEGWEFVYIHLAAAIFSIIVVNNHDIQNIYLKEKFLHTIIYFGSLIIFSTIIELLIGEAPGRLIFGNQNLTSLTLALTIPIAFIVNINNRIKYTYIIFSFISIAFLIKSRGVSLIALIVIFYYLKNNNQIFSKNIRTLSLVLLTICFAGVALAFNERFEDLLFGNSLYFRLFAWERFLYTIIDINPLIGYGPSNIVINFNDFQFINPQIELISGEDTFYNPHSEWLFMFASGGAVLLIVYCSIHFFLVLSFIGNLRKGQINNFTKVIFVCYLILILSAQYDINNTTYGTLLTFYLLQAILIKNLIKDKFINLDRFFYKLLLLIFLLLPVISQSYSLNFSEKYKSYVNSQLSLQKDVKWDLNNYAPHFKITDTINAYHYLNISGKNFNDYYFNNLIINARKYNKYYEPSLHLSTQYFSFKRKESELLLIYSDILYKLLNNKKLINISSKPESIVVAIGDENIYQIDKNIHMLTLTPVLFNELIRSNASFGNYMIDDFNNFSFNIKTDSSDTLIYKNVVKDFLNKLSGYSVPLNMSMK